MSTKKTVAKAATKKEAPAAAIRGRKPKFSLPADHPLEIAAKLVGGKRPIAEALGITRNSMRGMERRLHEGRPFPAERVVPICALTGQRPADFRPDVFHPDWKIPGVKAPTAAQLAKAVEGATPEPKTPRKRAAKAPKAPKDKPAARRPRARKADGAETAAAA